MQPLYLEMQAYGPYVEKTVIDFNELPDNLTLISGNTGAGKTTIFDAICCALFGESSGRDRSFKQMRSDFSKDNTPTKINFKFRIKDQDYEILRYAPYERKKRNSDETTFVNAKAELVLPDKTVITGVKNVNDKINDILGIGQDEFRQIVMIAQNDFMAMIKEAGKKQEKIFNRIFNAKLYENFSKKIFEKNKIYKQKVNEEGSQIIAALNNAEIDYDPGNINTEDINTVKLQELIDSKEVEAKTNYKNINKKLNNLKDKLQKEQIKRENAKKIVEDFSLRDKAFECLKSLDSRKPEIDKLILRKSLAVKARDQVEASYITYQKALKTLEELKETQKHKKLEEKEREELYKKQDKVLSKFTQDELNKLYSNYKNILDDLPKYQELFNVTQELEKDTQDEENLKVTLSKLQNEIKHKEEEALSIEIKPDEFFKTENERLKLKQKEFLRDKEVIVTYNNNLVYIINILKDLKTSRETLKTLRDRYYLSKETYDQAFKSYINNQAAFLAQGLEEGDACPVCGSRNHPKLAILEDTNITQEDLDSLKIKQEEADKALREEINSYNNLKTSYNFNLNNIEQNFKELPDLDSKEDEFLKNFLKNLKEIQTRLDNNEEFIQIGSLKDLNKILKVLIKRTQDSLDEIDNNIKDNKQAFKHNKEEKEKSENLKIEIESLKVKIKDLEESLVKTREQIISLKTQKVSLQEKCIYSNLEEAQRICNEQKKLYLSYDKDFKNARSNLEKASKLLESVKGEIKTLNEQIENSSKEYNDIKIKYLANLKEGGFISEEDFLEKRLTPEKLKTISGEIDSYNNQYLTLKTKIQELDKRLENSATRF